MEGNLKSITFFNDYNFLDFFTREEAHVLENYIEKIEVLQNF